MKQADEKSLGLINLCYGKVLYLPSLEGPGSPGLGYVRKAAVRPLFVYSSPSTTKPRRIEGLRGF